MEGVNGLMAWRDVAWRDTYYARPADGGVKGGLNPTNPTS